MDKEIYFKIYQYMVYEILWEWWHFAINLEEWVYVSIFRRADGDIDVSMYADEYHEEDLDWWWVIDMEWEEDILNWDIIDVLKYIKDKADFAYDLVFNNK
jgi:hypothetical protein